MQIRLFYFLACSLFFTLQSINAQLSIVNYTASDLDFPNPERGIYRYSETSASNYNTLDASQLAAYRNLHQPNTDPDYLVYSSLVFRYFILDDFVNASISQEFLDSMQIDFDQARIAGVKLIPRFTYTVVPTTGSCGSWICPPYGDASKARVLEHIGQLKDVFQLNSDVIAVVQMGFIGTWGEQYYTDHFGDASQSPFILTDTDWGNRNDVLDSLLKVLPEDRMVQVRYPQLKQRYIYGINAPTNAAALNDAEAFQGDVKSRIGFHNDCYLASADDFGTYADYGNSTTSSQSDTSNLKPYQSADSKFGPMGGETCSAYNPIDNCSSSDPDARADTEMKRMHFSYINADFNYPDVNSDWVNVCFEEMKREMGYRFELISSTINSSADAGSSINAQIQIQNVGYASPYNPRGVQLVFRNRNTAEEYFATLPNDPRFWFRETGVIEINEEICLSEFMEAGTYDLFLFLPDPSPSIYSRPEYAIRIASRIGGSEVWESATGYNSLGQSILISTAATVQTCETGISTHACKNLTENHVVLNTTDSDTLSLRSIILNANCGDTIWIDPSLDGQSISLTSGEITIDKDLVIIGTGQLTSIIDGALAGRIFNITADANVRIHTLKMQGGKANSDGGAFLNNGYLQLTGVLFENNFEGNNTKAFTNKNQVVIRPGTTSLKE